MLRAGNKIKMIKPIGMFNFPKQTFEVMSINKDDTINIISDIGFGVMTEDEYEKHFQRVREWTPWKKIGEYTLQDYPIGTYEMRTDNEKYTEVKYDDIRVRASCHPNDEFNLFTGIAICMIKLEGKQKR